jgi:hypothetical protein
MGRSLLGWSCRSGCREPVKQQSTPPRPRAMEPAGRVGLASRRLVSSVAVIALVASCGAATSPSPVPSMATGLPVRTPDISSEPTATPIAGIDHATGPTDVVLRFDRGPDYAISELTGVQFMPGPEFTLYGDGTVIFRDDRAKPPPAEGPIIRGQPFRIAHLDEDQIQALLRFATGEGGLGIARGRYETASVDDFGYSLFTLRAGGLDKRVQVVGSSTYPFEILADYLRDFDRGGGIPTQVWSPDAYWGVLTEAASLEAGLLPALPDTGAAPWPWPGIAPTEFIYRSDRYYVLEGDSLSALSAVNSCAVHFNCRSVTPTGANSPPKM